MATRTREPRSAPARSDDVVVDQYRVDDTRRQVSRLVALIAGGIVAVVGLAALFQMDWGNATLDSPVVEVAGMTFTPVVAGITTALGLLLLAVAAGRRGEGRIGLGAIVAVVGAAMLLVDQVETSWSINDRHGWLALVVGLVFVVTGLLSDRGPEVEHRRATAPRDRDGF